MIQWLDTEVPNATPAEVNCKFNKQLMERKVKVVLRDGKYGVIEDNIECVPFVHDAKKDAIGEWAYFEKVNTESEPHRRFLPKVMPIEFIEKTLNEYK